MRLSHRTILPAALAAAAPVAATAALGAQRHAPAPFASNPSQLANHCFAIESPSRHRYLRTGGTSYGARVGQRTRATPFFLKPTGLGTFLLFDGQGELLSVATDSGATTTSRQSDPGAAAEWTIAPAARRGSFTIVSTQTRLFLTTAGAQGSLVLVGRPRQAGRFAFAPTRGCRDYPEAQVGAFGTPHRGADKQGRVFGFVDLHVHITADMRAGGEVIYGESFDRYGITKALSADGDAAVHGQNGTLDVTGQLIKGMPGATYDNHGWPTFRGWPTHDTITHQQVYYVWLKRAWLAGLRLIVAQTVDDHALCEIEVRRDRTCDETQSIVEQVARLHEMQDYIDAQAGGRGRGWFRLAYTPAQARKVITQGKLAIVIGIESSDLFGCSEYLGEPQCTQSDIDRGIARYFRLGVRTLFPMHWVDNAFGGAALEGGFEGKAIDGLNVDQTGEPFLTENCPNPQEIEQPPADGQPAQCNSRGLTDLGAYLIRRLMAHHMLIEADHMSEKMRDSVIALAEQNHYPLISSHNGTGGSWSPAQLTALYRVGGMVSVTPDTAPGLATKILALKQYVPAGGYFGVGLGTDTGGLGGQPGPRSDAAAHPLRYPFRSYDGRVQFVRERTGTYTYDLNVEGVAHYGLLPDLIADIQQGHGDANALPPLFRSAEAYLETWQRAWRG
jgi:microsomal dipeptidase-like Zn-dependent dipeptidase